MTTPIALVTGGSRGLGRSMALHLAREGYDIIVTWQNNAIAANETCNAIRRLGRRAAAVHLDMNDSAALAAMHAQVQQQLQDWSAPALTALINNAGTGIHRPFAQTSVSEFDALMQVHFRGVFFLTQHLLPLMADGGHILNISSGLTRFSLPGHAAYAAMKGAIETLTRYLAVELAPRGIRVNVLAPGAIATDFGGGVVRDDPQVQHWLASNTALGRVGAADDIGAAAAALLARGGGWITGQRLEVSGGMFL